MAFLKNTQTGSLILIHPHHIIGRGREFGSDTLSNKKISSIHTVIRWNGEKWLIKDFSKNGTWLNRHRLDPSLEIELEQDAVISFDRTHNIEYQLINLSAPCTSLVKIDEPIEIIKLQALNALPKYKRTDTLIYQSTDGKWFVENAHNIRLLNEGQIIEIDKQAWRFFEAKIIDSTIDYSIYLPNTPSDISLHFTISLDSEHVELKLLKGKSIFDLGERSHHYLLFLLARSRLNDKKTGIDSSEQGWLDINSLSKMLGTDPSHVNIQIFRARKQICKTLKEDHTTLSIIERRRGAVRMGPVTIQIQRGSIIEKPSDMDQFYETHVEIKA